MKKARSIHHAWVCFGLETEKRNKAYACAYFSSIGLPLMSSLAVNDTVSGLFPVLS